MSLRRLSLLERIWLSTSAALTALFLVTGWVVQRNAVETTSKSLSEEVRASFQAYESLWKARAETLRSVSAIASSAPNVRAAFGTRDAATIRDTAGELWERISDDLKESALFFVTDPDGNLIAALGGTASGLPNAWPVVRAAASKFPQQVSGFYGHGGKLFQVVLTPVYVDSVRGPALINVLVAGYEINHLVAERLKESTGGSDLLFLSQGRVLASTLNSRATAVLAGQLAEASMDERVSDGVSEYTPLLRDLIDLEGKPVAKLAFFRSYDGALQRIGALRRDVVLVWLLALTAGLALTYVLVRKIVEPVRKLDLAASEVARQNYDHRVAVDRDDELGRLAATFNSMCASLQSARAELIRQERISTIGRLSSSIVHDLRNPLAAVYGGAEMLVDTDLPGTQVKRLAGNIYRASRRIKDLLDDLVNVSRGKRAETELCRLSDVVATAVESLRPTAELQGVELVLDVAGDIEVPLERARVERVFANLVGNALEVMPHGGTVRVSAALDAGGALVCVEDTGPGIAPHLREQLFQPFISSGKKGGLGLGLALSRQTVLDHGGDMWAAPDEGRGARFFLRLPKAHRTPETRVLASG
jgi:signal transduction histidine kinase